jgi:hypothetical protein
MNIIRWPLKGLLYLFCSFFFVVGIFRSFLLKCFLCVVACGLYTSLTYALIDTAIVGLPTLILCCLVLFYLQHKKTLSHTYRR